MGKALYDSVSNLTPQKKEIALFWADNPVATGTPGFHWISVVNQMIARRGLSADQAVEAYALTSVAIADAFIGCWKEKYRSMVVRPVTYVNRVFNPNWQTLFSTPPFPEYPSGHSTLSGAAVEVLVKLLGDTIPFTDSTQVDIGAPARSFRNFTHARDEVAVSRVYGGIHFVPAVVYGLTQGQCIGQRVIGRLKTRPNHS
jgi:membrane-associated phospholipid phosphatase